MSANGKVREKMHPMQTLFPCASGVTMPQFGAEDAEAKKQPRKALLSKLALKPSPVDNTPVNKRYLKKISSGIKFDEDVVKERCFFMMPYDTKYLFEALDISDIVASRPKVHRPVGRHNARGTDLRHMPCSLKTTKPPSLRPLKKSLARKALAMSVVAQGEVSTSSDSTSSTRSDPSKTTEKPTEVFMTEVSEEAQGKLRMPDTLGELQSKLRSLQDAAAKEAEEQKRPKSARMKAEKPKKEWDAFLMSQLSELTATWIVHERMSPNREKEELQKTLEEWYGKPKNTDLVHEEGSDSEAELDPFTKDKKVKPKKKWKKPEESLLERVYEQTPTKKAAAHDPYSDDNTAPFYRQPAGIRRQKKRFQKEEEACRQEQMIESAINATAHNIKVKSIKVPKPPTLRDFMPEGVGSTLFDTENQYEQELLAGVQQLHPAKGDGSIVVMASDHKYKKVLRHDYPDASEKWYPVTEKEKEKEAEKKPGQQEPVKRDIGAKRWRALPDPYDDTFKAQKVVPPGFVPQFSHSGDPVAKRQVKQNNTLSQILHEWRAKWNLSGQFADASFDDIIRDMADIQPHVRLKAIATVGKAAEYKPPSDPGIQLGSQGHSDDPISEIPEKIFVALDCLLGDSNGQVQRAAAITLYALERPTEKAEKILRKALGSEASSERWAAAQCLAHYGVCDSQVVDEIIKQILSSEEPIKHEQGISLLSRISNSMTLVHCIVAEQLNSSSWRHRVIACKILPTLYGSINKDVTHKLTDLMWHDWHTEVRCAAAQCLGKTSHGRDVHDDICRCIKYGNERTKLEAISRLGQLGIMTAKLLPAFLECFDDQYVSIRCECCITCGNLQIKEERVIDKLIHLATFDPIWKVKALAIQALGKVGVVNEAIKDSLLWAMRYEEKEAVRAEACHSLLLLEIMDEDVIQILQERLLVESSQVVRDEMVEALQTVGLSATEDMDMVAQIKGEVRKLCKRNVIASQIVLNEADELRQQNLQNMIYMSQEELERRYPKRNDYQKMLQMDQYKEYLHMQRKHKRWKEKEEAAKETALKRLRDLASTSEDATSTHPSSAVPAKEATDEESSAVSKTTTPDPYSREGTMFTPSADKELEAILNRDDVRSMPSRESSTKSRPVTGDETETSGTYTSPESMSRNSKPSLPEEYIEEVDRQLATATAQETFNLPLALTPARSRLGLTPSGSVIDMKESQVSLTQLSGRRTVISRETIREREKLNEHISATYAGLSARYVDMVDDLSKIDHGLNVAAPGSSKYLTVPGAGETPAQPPPAVPTEPSQDTMPETISDSTSLSCSVGEGTEAGDVNTNALNEDLKEEDGQVAISLEVPSSEQQSGNVQLVEESDKGDDSQSATFSTDYPSLVADDVAPSYLDDSGGEIPPSTYAGSTTYYNGAASDYGHSDTYDDDDQSTLD